MFDDDDDDDHNEKKHNLIMKFMFCIIDRLNFFPKFRPSLYTLCLYFFFFFLDTIPIELDPFMIIRFLPK